MNKLDKETRSKVLSLLCEGMIRAATNGGFVLGAARFQERIAAQFGRRVTPGHAGRPPRKVTERASAGPSICKTGRCAMAAADAKTIDGRGITSFPPGAPRRKVAKSGSPYSSRLFHRAWQRPSSKCEITVGRYP
jgi:hypothetical protein